MSLWFADVTETRRARFYVEAETREAAQEDADCLAAELGIFDADLDVDLTLVPEGAELKAARWVWVGGADGETVPASEWKPKTPGPHRYQHDEGDTDRRCKVCLGGYADPIHHERT